MADSVLVDKNGNPVVLNSTTTTTQTGSSTNTNSSSSSLVDQVKSWLGLAPDAINLGKTIMNVFTGKDYSDQEKQNELNLQLYSYQQQQQQKITKIILIAAATVVLSIILTILLTRKK